jgi:hypothetical protein
VWGSHYRKLRHGKASWACLMRPLRSRLRKETAVREGNFFFTGKKSREKESNDLGFTRRLTVTAQMWGLGVGSCSAS